MTSNSLGGTDKNETLGGQMSFFFGNKYLESSKCPGLSKTYILNTTRQESYI